MNKTERNMIQLWEPELTVIPANAKQDKIELSIDNIHVIGVSDDQVNRFFFELSIDPLYALADPRWAGMEHEDILNTLWFRHATGSANSTRRYEIRREIRISDHETYASLLTGKLRVTSDSRPVLNPGSPSQSRIVTLKADFQLNPTRFSAHQRMPPRSQLVRNPRHWPVYPPELYARKHISRCVEYSLDRSDNVHLAQSRQCFCRPTAWPMHLRACIEATIGQLRLRLERAAVDSGVALAFNPSLRLHSVETYWEFRSDNAMRAVDSVAPAVCTLSAWSQELKPKTALRSNSLSASAVLMSGTTLKIYAKTQLRLRVEITHGWEWLRRQGRQRTVTTLEDLLDLIYRIRDDAVRLFRRSLRIILPRAPRWRHTAIELVDSILAVSPDTVSARFFLSALVIAGRIDTGSEPQVRAVSTLLRRRGILRRPHRGSSVLVLTPDWLPALGPLRIKRLRYA